MLPRWPVGPCPTAWRVPSALVTAEVRIREGIASDFESWFALFDAVASEGKWIGREGPVDRAAAGAGFEGYMDLERRIHLFAESDGRVIGNISVQADRGVADIGMMVDSNWRGQGVGTLLLESAIGWARDHDCYKVALQVWPHNERAIALYTRFGFEEEGRLRRHYRRRNGELWDAVVMGLILDDVSPGSPY
jgi:RimJ/RimL family protein N-acetyltransferase